MIPRLSLRARLRCAEAARNAGDWLAETIAPELRETPRTAPLVPPVPYAVRLGLSGALLAIGIAAGIAAEWVTPELKTGPPATDR